MINALKRPVAVVLAALLLTAAIAPAAAVIEVEEAFYNTWARTDMPVSDGTVSRTWMWGPSPNTEVMGEEYADHPAGVRPVQYFDKSRMEVNNPNIEYDGLWYVTNGLLVVEMMTNMIQVGHNDFIPHTGPAQIHIAGDPNQPDAPTYATYANLRNTPAFADGAVISATVDANGNVGSNNDLASHGVTAGPLSTETGHRTASVFWEFMNSSGTVRDWESGDYFNGPLFQNPYYATGLPITEAYWAYIYVGGTQKWVLTQAFERRVLTFTPDNPAGWQVEAGNVGQHYYQWRYASVPPPPPTGPQVFHVYLGALNQSAVSGYGRLVLEDGMLDVSVVMQNLEPDEEHMVHIHGFGDKASGCPNSRFGGLDDLVSFDEGLPAYGPVVLPLEPYMTADQDGYLSFDTSYPLQMTGEMLSAHTFVVHGLEVNGVYDETVPVACGLIVPDDGFWAELRGEDELPDPVASAGYGFFTMHLLPWDDQIAISLDVRGLTDVTYAHIHIKDAGEETGPVILTLWDADDLATGEPAYGIIGTGIFEAEDFEGLFAGESANALLEAMLAGETYVNVHTVNYPAGELRGNPERISDMLVN